MCAIALGKESEFTVSRLCKDPVRRVQERRHTLLKVHRDRLVCSLVESESTRCAPSRFAVVPIDTRPCWR